MRNVNLIEKMSYQSKNEILKEPNTKKIKIQIKNKIFEFPHSNCKFLFEVIDKKFDVFEKLFSIENQIVNNTQILNSNLSQNVDWDILERNILQLEESLKNLFTELKDVYIKNSIKTEQVYLYFIKFLFLKSKINFILFVDAFLFK